MDGSGRGDAARQHAPGGKYSLEAAQDPDAESALQLVAAIPLRSESRNPRRPSSQFHSFTVNRGVGLGPISDLSPLF